MAFRMFLTIAALAALGASSPALGRNGRRFPPAIRA